MKEVNFSDMSFDVFKMFSTQWGIVTGGETVEDYNGMTIAWGSLGVVWGKNIVTAYVSPTRYTYEYMEKSDYFTVSFFPEACRPALNYMGSHSGRDEDKAANAGLTPVNVEPGVSYKEANLTFVCKKIYSDPFDPERSPEHYRDEMYKKVMLPHHHYIGEIIKILVPEE